METVNKSLLLFTLGPVQPFIAASRKTVDLFSGSMMLSKITSKAIASVLKNGGKLIFPFVENEAAINSDYNTRSIPNRFLAIVPSQHALSIAQAAEAAVIDRKNNGGYIHELAQKFKKKIDAGEKFADDSHWCEEWIRQPNAFWETYWAILDLPSDESLLVANYGDYYLHLERLIGRRKSLRDFYPLDQNGVKCKTFGGYAAAFPVGTVYKDAKAFSKKFLSQKFPGYYSEGETLSSLAIIKREYGFAHLMKEGFPSTITLANGRFNAIAVQKASEDDVTRTLMIRFIEEYMRIDTKLNNIGSKNYPSLLKRAAADPAISNYLRIDNDMLLSDSGTITAFNKIAKNELNPVTLEEFSSFNTARKKFIDAVGEQPVKYYAVFYFDGDNMGKWLSGSITDEQGKRFAVTPEVHQQFSKTLHEFSQVTARSVVEDGRLGKLVFAGGDDVIAFTTLDELMTIVKDVRIGFEKAMNETTGSFAPATGSCGIAIAHAGHDLQDVLNEARTAEHYAKETIGRNAFAIIVLKNSGEKLITGAKFTKDMENIALMEQYIAMVKNDMLSSGFVYLLEREIISLLDVHEKNDDLDAPMLALLESVIRFRLVQQTETMKRKNATETEKFLSMLKEGIQSAKSYTGVGRLIDILKVSQFIVRGGEL